MNLSSSFPKDFMRTRPWILKLQEKINKKNATRVAFSSPMDQQEHSDIQGHREKNKEKIIESSQKLIKSSPKLGGYKGEEASFSLLVDAFKET